LFFLFISIMNAMNYVWFFLACLGVLLLLVPIGYLINRIYMRANRKSFKMKIVLVTGGAMGIGKLMCEKLRASGAIVVIWDINQKALAEMKKGGFHTYMVDVTNREEVFRAQEKVKNDVGIIDILVNNAGIVNGKPLVDLEEERIRLLMDVNVLSHFWTCQAFLPDMMTRNSGHIVTISSMAGINGLPYMTDYCASKFACRGLAESLRLELRGTDIKTTVVHPFVINTGMFHGAKSPWCIWKLLGSTIDPNYAAQQILISVAEGQIRLLLPRRSFLLPAFAEILPWICVDFFGRRLFGLEEEGIRDPRKVSEEPVIEITMSSDKAGDARNINLN